MFSSLSEHFCILRLPVLHRLILMVTVKWLQVLNGSCYFFVQPLTLNLKYTLQADFYRVISYTFGGKLSKNAKILYIIILQDKLQTYLLLGAHQ